MPLEIPSQFNIARYFIDRPADAHPNRIAVAGEPDAVTYGELRDMVNRTGNALAGLGCAPGDRVLIVLPDSAEFVAAFFGAAKIGVIAVPVNPMTRAADYAYYLADSGARVAVVHQMAFAEFLGSSERRPEALERIIVVGASNPQTLRDDMLRWEEWVAGASSELEARATNNNETAFFLYTSGSGGSPKAAVHQHKDMFVTASSFAAGILGLRPEDRTFSVSKLFFAYGLGNGMYFPFSTGASTILDPERPRPDRVLDFVARHRPTIFFSVPTFYAALLREVEGGAKADFSSVRLAVSAGEALPSEVFEQWRKRFGLEILDGIGSTEMLHMFISSRPGQAQAGTCGIEVPNYEARVVDDQGTSMPAGEIGNLWVKGQSAFAGYWNKPELTGRARRGDWVVTGDKFFRDADGYYHYCGRTDDMLKVAGMWVSPQEVENALLGHPSVAEAAVVGERDSSGLTRPIAFVILRAGIQASSVLAREIRESARMRLPNYKCPQEIRFLDELPKTATGKIQRFRLR